ncbi:hypothetical protein EJB05_05676, partial [Eragrostis curvula]
MTGEAYLPGSEEYMGSKAFFFSPSPPRPICTSRVYITEALTALLSSASPGRRRSPVSGQPHLLRFSSPYFPLLIFHHERAAPAALLSLSSLPTPHFLPLFSKLPLQIPAARQHGDLERGLLRSRLLGDILDVDHQDDDGSGLKSSPDPSLSDSGLQARGRSRGCLVPLRDQQALVDSTGGSSCTQRKVVSQDTKMPEKLEKLRLQEHAL